MVKIKGSIIPPSIENNEYNERLIFPNALRLQKEKKKILIVDINPIINANSENSKTKPLIARRIISPKILPPKLETNVALTPLP